MFIYILCVNRHTRQTESSTFSQSCEHLMLLKGIKYVDVKNFNFFLCIDLIKPGSCSICHNNHTEDND